MTSKIPPVPSALCTSAFRWGDGNTGGLVKQNQAKRFISQWQPANRIIMKKQQLLHDNLHALFAHLNDGYRAWIDAGSNSGNAIVACSTARQKGKRLRRLLNNPDSYRTDTILKDDITCTLLSCNIPPVYANGNLIISCACYITPLGLFF